MPPTGALEYVNDPEAQPPGEGVSEQAVWKGRPSQANERKRFLPTGSRGTENHTSGIISDLCKAGKHS